jgi:hypothetical protein
VPAPTTVCLTERRQIHRSAAVSAVRLAVLRHGVEGGGRPLELAGDAALPGRGGSDLTPLDGLEEAAEDVDGFAYISAKTSLRRPM